MWAPSLAPPLPSPSLPTLFFKSSSCFSRRSLCCCANISSSNSPSEESSSDSSSEDAANKNAPLFLSANRLNMVVMVANFFGLAFCSSCCCCCSPKVAPSPTRIASSSSISTSRSPPSSSRITGALAVFEVLLVLARLRDAFPCPSAASSSSPPFNIPPSSSSSSSSFTAPNAIRTFISISRRSVAASRSRSISSLFLPLARSPPRVEFFPVVVNFVLPQFIVPFGCLLFTYAAGKSNIGGASFPVTNAVVIK
mmetsp:Transcript_8196/g.26119  ORF Transcript_8196/g.26119 Transcript_8196/m.26119 type:complete len:253 (+) Transcript_8196:5560-6318(+)